LVAGLASIGMVGSFVWSCTQPGCLTRKSKRPAALRWRAVDPDEERSVVDGQRAGGTPSSSDRKSVEVFITRTI
jgi:hypothetical protein